MARTLVVGFFLGAAGFAAHLIRSEVEWTVLAVSLVGAIHGAWLGARSTGRLGEATLRALIGIALLLVSAVVAVTAAVG